MEPRDAIPEGTPRRRRVVHALWPLAASGMAVFAFRSIGASYLDSWALDLGSLSLPSPRHTYFLFWWTLLGSAAALFAAVGVTRAAALVAESRPSPARGIRIDDRLWVGLVAAGVFVASAAIRAFVLRGAPLTDDESAYRFMGEVLAAGRLWVESHPAKAFFDRVFMINDGRVYAQYFIGWPALMVPGVYVGATGYMNAFYSALTVPALFGIVRRLAGAGAARMATLLYLASPMLMVGAATELSHPSCLMALAWTFYFHLRSVERPEAWWTHAGVAAFFGLAFLIRPTSALGVGLPVLIAWFWTIWKPPGLKARGHEAQGHEAQGLKARGHRALALVAFGLPAVMLAAIFFGVNTAQNGSPLATSYARMQAYMKEVGYRNVGWSPDNPPSSLSAFMLPNANVGKAVAGSTIALVRLAYDLFAAPVTLGLVAFAWALGPSRLSWMSVLCFVVIHFYTGESGVDAFGPAHYYELALPVLVLSGIGYAHGARWARHWRPAMPPGWLAAVAAVILLVSLAGYAPVRLAAAKRIADAVNLPADAVRKARVSNAIVFSAGLFVPQECSAPTRHFVYFRPNNDPWLTNDVLWANHLGWEVDQELLRHFPSRTGYLMTWKDCRPHLMRITS